MFAPFVLLESALITRQQNAGAITMITKLWRDFALFTFTLVMLLHTAPGWISWAAERWGY